MMRHRIDDQYGVLQSRKIRVTYAAAGASPTYEHVECGVDLKPRDVEDNWCPQCAATLNKAAQRRAQAEWKN